MAETVVPRGVGACTSNNSSNDSKPLVFGKDPNAGIDVNAMDVVARSQLTGKLNLQGVAEYKLLVKAQKTQVEDEAASPVALAVAPSTSTRKYFEEEFARPANFVVVKPGMLPFRPGESVADAVTKFCSNSCDKNARLGMQNIIEVLLIEIKEILKGKVHKIFQNAIVNAGMVDDQGLLIITMRSLKAYWKTMNPTPEILEKIHNIIHASVGAPGVCEAAVYETHIACKLWPEITKRTIGAKASATCIRTIFHNKKREVIGFFSKKSSSLHGLTLTISVPKGSGLGRRQRDDGFNMKRLVAGWAGEKHKAYLEKNSLSIPTCDVSPLKRPAPQPRVKGVKASDSVAKKVCIIAVLSCNIFD